MTTAGDRTRRQCRRPIAAYEVAYLQQLGFVLARLRQAAFLSQTELARGAQVSRQTVARVEAGTRRTRASTLRAMAEVLAATRWVDLGYPEELTAELVRLAGPALAPESLHAEGVKANRARRAARWERRARVREAFREYAQQQRLRR